jgi:hypothetical protein
MQVHRVRRILATKPRGSSWPLIVDTDAGPSFAKLRGAGQGTAALVAEVVVAGLAEAVGLRVPRRSLVVVDSATVCEDRDPELLGLVAASHGANLGFEVLTGARDFRPEDVDAVSSDEASIVVWLDWLVMNPDRTSRNPNLLLQGGRLWLIDHGAALPFHHNWRAVTEDSPHRAAFSFASHVLCSRAAEWADWDGVLTPRLDRDTMRAAVDAVPDEFLAPLLPPGAPAGAFTRRREAYGAFLWKRLKAPRPQAPRIGFLLPPKSRY